MENQSNREIVLSRVYDAPLEKVWFAFTKRKQVVTWWGPDGFTNTTIEMNVRPGGVWKHIMHGPDGTEYPNQVVYDQVEKFERLSFTHFESDEPDFKPFQTIITFDDVGENQTKVVMRSIFASMEEKDRQVYEVGAVLGGSQTLARLAEFLKNNKE
jgi:uncharacterized protein YndB with AHSA1/START domain